MTPAQKVVWAIVGAGILEMSQVRIQYIDERWGVVPRTTWENESPRILHICQPRKIYWEAKAAYRLVTCQIETPAGRIKGPFEVGVESQPWGPGIRAKKLFLTMNGFRVLEHSALAWNAGWNCHKLETYHDECEVCFVKAPKAALGLQKFMFLAEKI